MIAPKNAPRMEALRNAAGVAVAKMTGKPGGPSTGELLNITESLADAVKAQTRRSPPAAPGADGGPAAHRVDTTRLRDSSGRATGGAASSVAGDAEGAASARQIEANRANAQKSTGPRTEAGKARSSRNALRHGLFSKAAVLPGEDAEEYARLSLNLFMIYQPGPEEEDKVARLARLEWHLQRVRAAEAEIGRILGEQGKTAARALAEDYMGIGNSGLLRMMNHEMRIGNSILSIKRQLAKMQKDRPWTDSGCDASTGYEAIGDLTQYSEESLRALLGGSNAPLDGSKPNGADVEASRENEADLGTELSARTQNEPESGGCAPPEARVA